MAASLSSFTQDKDAVTAKVKDRTAPSPTSRRIPRRLRRRRQHRAHAARHQAAGEANMLQLRQALYYCDDLYERIPIGKGRHYHVADAKRAS